MSLHLLVRFGQRLTGFPADGLDGRSLTWTKWNGILTVASCRGKSKFMYQLQRDSGSLSVSLSALAFTMANLG